MSEFRQRPVDRVGGVAWEVALVKLSRVRDDLLLGEWVPEQPALVGRRVSNEDAFLSVRLQLVCAFVLLDQHIGGAAKNSKMAHSWFLPVPELIGRRSCAHRCRGTTIAHMDVCSKSVPPKRTRELGFIEQSNDMLHDRPICTFCNAILVRLSSDSVLTLNPLCHAKRLPCIGHVLASLVIPECLDFAIQLVLSKSFELLECRKRASLVLERQNDPKATEVVNEGDPVPGVVSGAHRERAVNV